MKVQVRLHKSIILIKIPISNDYILDNNLTLLIISAKTGNLLKLFERIPILYEQSNEQP